MSIFWSGNSGVSTGAHLHFGVWDPRTKSYIDPMPFASLLESGSKPVRGQFPITSPFGPRQAPTAGASSEHRGVDFHMPEGTPVEFRGGRWRGAWEDKGGGGVVGEYEFDTTDGRRLLARLMHGQPRNLQQAALVPGRSPGPRPTAAASVAAGASELPAPDPEPPPPPDWRTAAGDPGRSTDPSSQAYWQRADIQQWAAAHQGLAAEALARAGADPSWLPLEARPPDRGALNGVRVGGPSPRRAP